jgi:hypothetical protein
VESRIDDVVDAATCPPSLTGADLGPGPSGPWLGRGAGYQDAIATLLYTVHMKVVRYIAHPPLIFDILLQIFYFSRAYT